MSKEAGGPAFPAPINPGHKRQDDSHMNGMTLRDYFAAKAMQGMLAGQARASHDRRAQAAYEIADAMLAERAK